MKKTKVIRFRIVLAALFFVLIALLMANYNASAADTIYVKKVFLNGKAITVKDGFIIREGSIWIVNGKKVKFYRHKETEAEDFKGYVKK